MNETEKIQDIVEILELSEEEIKNDDENLTVILDLQDLKSLQNLYNLYKTQKNELKEKNEVIDLLYQKTNKTITKIKL